MINVQHINELKQNEDELYKNLTGAPWHPNTAGYTNKSS